jgi:predicted regulator of Ras-like GTPase activity (Roadblock/LC7/MglB family)
MSFDQVLQSIVDQGKGVLGAVLMGGDGIAIASAQPQAASGHVDISTAGVEFERILAEVDKASDAIGGGPVSELVVTLASLTLIFSVVEDDVMMVVALAPDGNLGKARYLIRRNLVSIRQEL